MGLGHLAEAKTVNLLIKKELALAIGKCSTDYEAGRVPPGPLQAAPDCDRHHDVGREPKTLREACYRQHAVVSRTNTLMEI